ncbi:MAG: restriction endonuclease subunit S [Rhodanobacter sp.]
MILKMLPFEEVVRSRGSGTQGLPQSEWITDGQYAVIGQGSEFIEGRTNRQDLLVRPSPSIVLYGGHTRRAKYVDFPFVPGPNVKILEAKDKSILDNKYLFYFLSQLHIDSRGYADHFPQVKRSKIPYQQIDDQIRIAHLLGKVEDLIASRKQQLAQLDALLKSVFLEMFGDPVRNDRGWEKPPLRAFGKITTGNTPPRNDPSNYDIPHIEWIKTDNIEADTAVVTQAAEYLSEAGVKRSRAVDTGALLVACIAGSVESIGRAALTDRTVAFNQQINAIQPGADVDPIFLYALFKLSRTYIQSHATKGMKKILTKGDFEQIPMVKPPPELQREFAAVAKRIEALKSRYQQTLTDLETLYAALSQSAFKGELDLSRIPLPAAALEPTPMEDGTAISIGLDVPTSLLPDLGLTAEALANEAPRLALLTAWLEAWQAHLGPRPFRLPAFLDAAQTRLQTLYPESELERSMAAYEQIKDWVFAARASG